MLSREVLAMVDEDHGKTARRRSLDPIESEYDRLCDKLGGPADIGLTDPGATLAIYWTNIRRTAFCQSFFDFNPMRVRL